MRRLKGTNKDGNYSGLDVQFDRQYLCYCCQAAAGGGREAGEGQREGRTAGRALSQTKCSEEGERRTGVFTDICQICPCQVRLREQTVP